MQANPVSPFRRRTALASLVVAGALALAGCAALQPKTPEEIVTQRVEARWDALIKGDFPAAWAYTQPAYRAIVIANAAAALTLTGRNWAQALADAEAALSSGAAADKLARFLAFR